MARSSPWAGVTSSSIKGQRVLADTFGQFDGFAELVVAKADLFVPVPDGIDPVVAAALPQSGTIALAGMRDRVSAGQSVLINGAGGGSGPLAVQLAVAAGARVTAVDRAAKRTALDPLGIGYRGGAIGPRQRCRRRVGPAHTADALSMMRAARGAGKLVILP